METALHQLARQLYLPLSPAQLLQNTTSNVSERKSALAFAQNLPISFWEQFGSACKKKAQTLCVHTTASYCVYLVDLLDTYKQQLKQTRLRKEELYDYLTFYHSLQSALLALLDLIHHSFSQHCNPEQKMPVCLAKDKVDHFAELLTRIEQIVDDHLDQDIKTFTCACFQKYCFAGVLNYGTYAYLDELLTILLHPAHLLTESWISLLIRYNFNDTEWVDRLMKYYLDQRELLIIDEAKKESWETIRLGIMKLQPLPNKALIPAQKECKELLLETIHTEESLVAAMSPTLDKNTKPFETSLSVSQLGLFLRLQVDAQILQTNNKNELIRQMAAQFRTTRVNHISHENLYKKFYTCDPAAISIMRTHLANMMNCLKNYG